MQELWTVVLVLEESQSTSWPRWHNCWPSQMIYWASIGHGQSSALWESRPAGAGQALPGEGSGVFGREHQGWQPLLLWPAELWLCPRNIWCHMVSGGLNIPLLGTQEGRIELYLWIFIQWVLGHLTDEHLEAFFVRCIKVMSCLLKLMQGYFFSKSLIFF